MKADFPDRLVHQYQMGSRLAADSERYYGQSRQEAQTLGQAQAGQETNLRRAAEMETGRGRNIQAIA